MKEIIAYKKYVLEKYPLRKKLLLKELLHNWKTLLLCLVTLLVLNSANKFILQLLENFKFFDFTKQFGTTIPNTILFLGFFFFSIIRIPYIYLYQRKLSFSIFGILIWILFYTSYFWSFRPYVYLIEFTTFGSIKFFYSDLFIVTLGLYLLNFKPYSKLTIEKNEYNLYEDDFDFNSSIDELKRHEIAQNISQTIEHTITKKAFAISIVGEWGEGKTTFIKFIINELEKNRKKNVIIEFNPWKTSNTNLLIKEFFSQLINKANEFDSDLKKKLILYLKNLIGNKNTIVEFLWSISNLFFNKENESLEYSFEKINEAISNSGKRFIVFIDDLDRLSGSEIIEVLKIIRNTSNFCNVFFITGLDMNYVREALNKSNSIALEHNYTKKIFQLEFVLPPINSNWLITIFEKIFTNDEFLKSQKDELIPIIHSFNQDQFHLEKALFENKLSAPVIFESPRDVIRTINSLKVALKLVLNYAILKDILALEIIKSRFLEIYIEIAKVDSIFEFAQADETGKSKVMVKDESIKNALVKYSHLQKYENTIITLLNKTSLSLYNSVVPVNSLVYKDNHRLYFNYLTEGIITPEEMKQFWQKEPKGQLEMIEKWGIEERTKNLNNFVLSKNIFSNVSDFVNYLKLLALLSEKNQSLFGEFRKAISNYSIGLNEIHKQELRSEIYGILKNKKLGCYTRSMLTNEMLYGVVKGKNELFYENQKSELQNICLETFQEHLNEKKSISYETFRFYYNNIDYIDNEDKIILTGETNRLFRKFIDDNKTDYLKIHLRPYYTPPNEIYNFEPFVKQTFETEPGNGLEEFEKFIEEYNDEPELKKFISVIFQRFKVNDFKPVRLEEGEIKYLNEIQKKFKMQK